MSTLVAISGSAKAITYGLTLVAGEFTGFHAQPRISSKETGCLIISRQYGLKTAAAYYFKRKHPWVQRGVWCTSSVLRIMACIAGTFEKRKCPLGIRTPVVPGRG
jgi:hypothetical protein